ncbi:MAG TPA: glycosyltransferase [Proteobacteria bacterium]|nr:glycosyltransferase [Pseudomonadota bacterium]
MAHEVEDMLGYPVTTQDRDACVKQILSWIDSGQKARYFVCANPHSITEAESDPVFKEALKNADLITPDGIGIVIASKMLGGNIRDRVTGSDIFAGLNSALNERNGNKVFFLGSTEETLAKIKDKIAQEFPNIKAVGTYSPPFKPKFAAADNRLMIEAINNFRPDVLWVGMTAPKQEKWIYQNKDRLDVKFIGAIGAVFDFFTGNVKRSNPFFLKTGLEWLPRLLQEPRRLWRRNVISNPKFLFRVI